MPTVKAGPAMLPAGYCDENEAGRIVGMSPKYLRTCRTSKNVAERRLVPPHTIVGGWRCAYHVETLKRWVRERADALRAKADAMVARADNATAEREAAELAAIMS